MKKIALLLLPVLLAGGCSWVTYNDNGHTRLRQKHPTGTPVYYQDGTYQHDQRYNEYRPQQRAVERTVE